MTGALSQSDEIYGSRWTKNISFESLKQFFGTSFNDHLQRFLKCEWIDQMAVSFRHLYDKFRNKLILYFAKAKSNSFLTEHLRLLFILWNVLNFEKKNLQKIILHANTIHYSSIDRLSISGSPFSLHFIFYLIQFSTNKRNK